MSSSFKNNTTNIIKATTIGTRILAQVGINSVEAGTTAGDVLRNGFSGGTSFYFRAGATSAAASRVFGVVENIRDKNVDIVLQGLMQYPSSLIAGAPTTENFFLSAATAGKVQSYAPTPAGQISKKVLQQATVGAFNATVIGASDFESGENVGAVQASKTSDAPVGTVLPYLSVTGNTATIPEGWVDGSTMQYLSVSDYAEYNTQFGDIFGFEETLTLTFTTSDFASGLVGTQVATDQDSTNKHDRSTGGAIVTNVDTVNNKLTIRQNKYNRTLYSSGITSGSTPLFEYSIPPDNINFERGNLIGYISSGVLDKNATPHIRHNTSNMSEPYSLQGMWPLYSTPEAANAASPNNPEGIAGSNYHIHDGRQFGVTYGTQQDQSVAFGILQKHIHTHYMPNGLKLVNYDLNTGIHNEDELQYHGATFPGGSEWDGTHNNPVTDYLMRPTGTAIQTLYTMKVKNVVAVDIPSQVTIQTLNVTHGLSAGSSANNVVTTDVAFDVQCMKNRLRDLEIRILGSEQSCTL